MDSVIGVVSVPLVYLVKVCIRLVNMIVIIFCTDNACVAVIDFMITSLFLVTLHHGTINFTASYIDSENCLFIVMQYKLNTYARSF